MATKIKAKTLISVPQSRDDCAQHIRILGDLQREFARCQAGMNDEIAAIAQLHQPLLADLQARMDALSLGIQTWAEANRVALCGENDAKGKTANLVTGELSWRQRPPSITVRGAEAVVEVLKRMGLTRFIRSKEEINKEAMLNEKDAVRGIPGITVTTGLEDFAITPFEQQAEAA